MGPNHLNTLNYLHFKSPERIVPNLSRTGPLVYNYTICTSYNLDVKSRADWSYWPLMGHCSVRSVDLLAAGAVEILRGLKRIEAAEALVGLRPVFSEVKLLGRKNGLAPACCND